MIVKNWISFSFWILVFYVALVRFFLDKTAMKCLIDQWIVEHLRFASFFSAFDFWLWKFLFSIAWVFIFIVFVILVFKLIG